jgi:hypothetical protein
MKALVIRAPLFALLIAFLNGCASSETDVTGMSKPQPAGAVPGETLPDDERIAPGGFGNPSPSVRW